MIAKIPKELQAALSEFDCRTVRRLVRINRYPKPVLKSAILFVGYRCAADPNAFETWEGYRNSYYDMLKILMFYL